MIIGGEQMKPKYVLPATVGKLNVNPIVRFNANALEHTGIKEKDVVKVEYFKNKIVITKEKK